MSLVHCTPFKIVNQTLLGGFTGFLEGEWRQRKLGSYSHLRVWPLALEADGKTQILILNILARGRSLPETDHIRGPEQGLLGEAMSYPAMMCIYFEYTVSIELLGSKLHEIESQTDK